MAQILATSFRCETWCRPFPFVTLLSTVLRGFSVHLYAGVVFFKDNARKSSRSERAFPEFLLRLEIKVNLIDLASPRTVNGDECYISGSKKASIRPNHCGASYIPKGDGKQRPISIPALEDNIVQRAVVDLLNAIYEQDFLDCSYGFRPKRGQHQALDEVGQVICTK